MVHSHTQADRRDARGAADESPVEVGETPFGPPELTEPNAPVRRAPGGSSAHASQASAKDDAESQSGSDAEWGFEERGSGVALETKLAVALVVCLCGALCFVVWQKSQQTTGTEQFTSVSEEEASAVNGTAPASESTETVAAEPSPFDAGSAIPMPAAEQPEDTPQFAQVPEQTEPPVHTEQIEQPTWDLQPGIAAAESGVEEVSDGANPFVSDTSGASSLSDSQASTDPTASGEPQIAAWDRQVEANGVVEKPVDNSSPADPVGEVEFAEIEVREQQTGPSLLVEGPDLANPTDNPFLANVTEAALESTTSTESDGEVADELVLSSGDVTSDRETVDELEIQPVQAVTGVDAAAQSPVEFALDEPTGQYERKPQSDGADSFDVIVPSEPAPTSRWSDDQWSDVPTSTPPAQWSDPQPGYGSQPAHVEPQVASPEFPVAVPAEIDQFADIDPSVESTRGDTAGDFGGSSTAVPDLTIGGTGQSGSAYTVQNGDSYWSISRKQYGTIRYFSALAQLNSKVVSDPKKLRPGMVISTPPARELDAQFGLAAAAPRQTAAAAPDSSGFFIDAQGRPGYRVGRNDTLTRIAHRHLGRASRWVQIYSLNRDVLPDPHRLKQGTVLQLPADAGGTTRVETHSIIR